MKKFGMAVGAVSLVVLAVSAVAQNMAARPASMGQLTDTRTGKVWTPSWESKDAYQPTDPSR